MPIKKSPTLTKPEASQGFTIIEVVLVLAIAGLIFIMVFVALPALQRSQRDTARRNDLARVGTSLTQWQTNHNGNLPNSGGSSATTMTGNKQKCNPNETSDAEEFVCNYMNSSASDSLDSSGMKENVFKDPDGKNYDLYIVQNIAEKNLNAGAVTAGSGSGLAVDGNNAALKLIDTKVTYNVFVIPGGVCTDDATVKVAQARYYAILYRLEGAGTYCIDDQ